MRLKFGQNGLLAAAADNYNDGPTTTTYQANLAQGQADSRNVLRNAPPSVRSWRDSPA